MSTADGQRRIPVADIAVQRLDVRAHAARVELGHSAGDQVRVRWTVPARRLLPAKEPRMRLSGAGLMIDCRKGRLRIDLPSGMTVTVRLRRGQITSWGADADLDLATREGSVACRELRSGVSIVKAPEVNLHFADVPRLVDLEADRALVALPGGPYFVSAPVGAVIEVPLVDGAAAGALAEPPRINIRRGVARILAAGTPLSLTDESADG